jgi:hypothetical protein
MLLKLLDDLLHIFSGIAVHISWGLISLKKTTIINNLNARHARLAEIYALSRLLPASIVGPNTKGGLFILFSIDLTTLIPLDTFDS